MTVRIGYTGRTDGVALRDVFARVLARIGEDPDFVYLDADLMSSVGTRDWALAHPDKAFNMGVAEADMMGVAAGLAAAGFRPLVQTFGPFASRRCFDQVFLSVAYSGRDLTVIGTDPGVTAAFNGGTHMPFEDMALYRAIPGATVLDMADAVQLEAVLPLAYRQAGLKYIRFGRKPVLPVYASGSTFDIGRAPCLREGRDATIVASGLLVAESLAAADRLAAEGLSVTVLDAFCIKPLDGEAILAWAGRTGALVTAENHNVIGGLGSAVAELLAEHGPCPLERVGVREAFGEVGPQDYLQRRFGLTADDVADAVRRVVLRKAGAAAGQ